MRFLRTTALVLAASVAMAPLAALAGKPEWAGNGKNKHQQDDNNDQGGRTYSNQPAGNQTGVSVDIHIGNYFQSNQREQVQTYYREQARSGHCPPGLAKKNNGCMPPGQAKKWAMGQPLPRDVVYTPIDPRVMVRLGTPPAGHRYVQVAADILLIAVGTSMVIDAIQDLGR